MSSETYSGVADRRLLVAIMIVLVVYGASAAFRLPQMATERMADARAQETRANENPGAASNGANDAARPAASDHAETHAVAAHPPYWMAIPFALLLLAIAVLPLTPAVAHWWESNLHRFYVAGGLAVLTLAYYAGLHANPIESHWPSHHIVGPASSGPNFGMSAAVFANALLAEYIPFMVLLFSLYTISGGIRIVGDMRAHPLTNAMFLVVGAVLASIVGTTGAAMILIRPLLETNAERKHVQHTVVFFIFVVCNCGGLLLPTGDPPLFLGYLLGVDFFWTLRLWPAWLFINGALVAIYCLIDAFWYYPREAKADIARDEQRVHPLRIRGLWPNAILLLGVVAAASSLSPSKGFPGTDWRPWLYLREVAQLSLVALSLLLGDRHLRRANNFSYGAIVEVAVLFFGIFVCMQPPLQILNVEGPNLGLTTPTQFFWSSGLLSSFLDNAPTYVVFFQTAKTIGGTPAVAGVAESLLWAVSLGSVLMGANTYIGNGPNFMVKAIAEKSRVQMPSFFGYMLYSALILLPLFALTNWIFLR